MRNITKEELNEILRKHELWLEGKDGGERANLYRADLSNANLYRANLREAYLGYARLYRANLREANLDGANLCEAYLRYANVSNANLHGANLSDANLDEAYLYRANFRNANLGNANLRGAYLLEADLDGANLRGANLDEAYLYRANLRNANLGNANLREANLLEADLREVKVNSRTAFFHLQCPEEGSFIGWKKAVCNYNFVIVKLLITEDALRSSATTRKCRASKAKVLDIQDLDGNSLDVCSAHSDYDVDFIYKVGEVVEVDNFDPDRWKECSAGIHFFITRQEAVDYGL